MAADADGTILGVRADHLDEVGAYSQAAAPPMGADLHGPYRIPKLSFSTQVRLHQHLLARRTEARGRSRPTCANKRSTGSRASGIDPLELRRRNVIQRDQLPHLLPVGLPLDHVSLARRWSRAAIITRRSRRDQQEQFQAGRLLGIGIGLYIEPQAAMGPMPPSRRTSVSSRAAVSTCTSGRGRTDKASRRRPRSSSPNISVSRSTR
jgi:carbon-monoxide dehydrogenase large subunit